jgi:N-methylhydantoinase A
MSAAATGGRYRITVDTGGTFTDLVVSDSDRIRAIGKALTTPERISRGLLAALDVAAAELGLDARALLERTDLFIYASTRATNAILERKTATTALLVTRGFPDILVRREGGKTNPWDFSVPYPPPYVPKRLTFEVPERIGAEGDVVELLDEAAVRELLADLPAHGVQAVAVCLLWSVVNGRHERRIGDLIEEVLPGVPYTLSHRLNPILREYRRASSAAIDASLKLLMQEHLRELEVDLDAAGLRCELLPATSLGGVMPLAEVVERPIHLVRSGPALAPILGRTLAQAEGLGDDVVICDTGGTSFDVSLVRGGRLVYSRDTWLGGRYVGHLTGLSSVDARSIGAGGGSIAWIDDACLLRVGPQSAGSLPGPACYGRGGTQPTVTDSALVLGYLDPQNFLGGRMTLDAAAARDVVGHLAARLGTSLESAAAGVLTLASEHMVEAISEITINEGVDPRTSLLVAGGGAAGLNIVPIARELGCARVLVPRTAGALSACGAQFSDIVAEAVGNCATESDSFAFETVGRTLDALGTDLAPFAARMRERGVDDLVVEYFAEARYRYQVWELEVPLGELRCRDAAELERLLDRFHEQHAAVFAVNEPGQIVEFMQWKARLTAVLPKPAVALDGAPTAAADARRARAYFMDVGSTVVPIHAGAQLGRGSRVTGPALIVEPTTTVVLYPRSIATVTANGNYLIDVGSAASGGDAR